ncbi:glycosyltransferase family 2 protein [Brevibacillus sp. HB1.1]|uniref:glycosyltransferase family 2 protein n=1 Tax=Brevibacillus sp. HB1.1 TaxID=2738808 RepID=UPI001575400E|nr:glycosyltransferase family 2 protein [Brevibacillus sp. HB1.1]NTU31096.1 glycosyltransferase family 2 protein [Brevibacillus sp. HB1.1]
MNRKIIKKVLLYISTNRFLRHAFSLLPSKAKEDMKIAMKKVVNFLPEKKPQINQEQVKFPGIKNQKELVSIILPVYNHSEYLSLAVESVLNQTYKNFELIIVDDGSDEHLLDQLRKFLNDKRVRYIRQEHAGLPIALNTGFSVAQGEFLSWTSADNIMGKTNIEQLVYTLEKNHEKTFVYADYRIIDEHGQHYTQSSFRIQNQSAIDSSIIELPDDDFLLSRVHDNFIGPSFLYKRFMSVIGNYNDSIGVEDYDYWIRGNEFFSFTHLGQPASYYQYRVHSDSLSAKAKELKIAEKARQTLERVKERRLFLKKEVSIFIQLSGTDLENELRRGLKKWSTNSSSASANKRSVAVFDFNTVLQQEIEDWDKVIVLVSNTDRLFEQKNRVQYDWIYVTFDEPSYHVMRNMALTVFFIAEVSQFPSVVCAISATLFDTCSRYGRIEYETISKLMIQCTSDSEKLQRFCDRLLSFGHAVHRNYQEDKGEIIVFDVYIHDQHIASNHLVNNILFFVDTSDFFADWAGHMDTAVYVCTDAAYVQQLLKKGVSSRNIYLIAEITADSTRRLEIILASIARRQSS